MCAPSPLAGLLLFFLFSFFFLFLARSEDPNSGPHAQVSCPINPYKSVFNWPRWKSRALSRCPAQGGDSPDLQCPVDVPRGPHIPTAVTVRVGISDWTGTLPCLQPQRAFLPLWSECALIFSFKASCDWSLESHSSSV